MVVGIHTGIDEKEYKQRQLVDQLVSIVDPFIKDNQHEACWNAVADAVIKKGLHVISTNQLDMYIALEKEWLSSIAMTNHPFLIVVHEK